AIVARPGQTLGRDRALLRARPRLQGVEEPEADRLLQLGIALELDVRAVPEVVEEGALAVHEPVPARVLGLRARGDGLVSDRAERPRTDEPGGEAHSSDPKRTTARRWSTRSWARSSP